METIVVLELTARDGAADELLDCLRGLVPETREFDGCIDVVVQVSTDNPNSFMAYERWASVDNYKRYLRWRTETGKAARLLGLLGSAPSMRTFDPVEIL